MAAVSPFGAREESEWATGYGSEREWQVLPTQAAPPHPQKSPYPPSLVSAHSEPDTGTQQLNRQFGREQFERAAATQPAVAPPDDPKLGDFKRKFDASMASMLAGARAHPDRRRRLCQTSSSAASAAATTAIIADDLPLVFQTSAASSTRPQRRIVHPVAQPWMLADSSGRCSRETQAPVARFHSLPLLLSLGQPIGSHEQWRRASSSHSDGRSHRSSISTSTKPPTCAPLRARTRSCAWLDHPGLCTMCRCKTSRQPLTFQLAGANGELHCLWRKAQGQLLSTTCLTLAASAAADATANAAHSPTAHSTAAHLSWRPPPLLVMSSVRPPTTRSTFHGTCADTLSASYARSYQIAKAFQ